MIFRFVLETQVELYYLSPLRISRVNFPFFFFVCQMSLRNSVGRIVKAFRTLNSKLQTEMDTFPFLCLVALGVISGIALTSELQLRDKLFILGYSSFVICSVFMIY